MPNKRRNRTTVIKPEVQYSQRRSHDGTLKGICVAIKNLIIDKNSNTIPMRIQLE